MWENDLSRLALAVPSVDVRSDGSVPRRTCDCETSEGTGVDDVGDLFQACIAFTLQFVLTFEREAAASESLNLSA